MTFWNRLMLATAIGAAAAFMVGYFLASTMSFWAAVAICYVSGVAVGALALAGLPPRRSRRTKHRHGQ